jgi:tetratricopeptide (TPR) repeat protein
MGLYRAVYGDGSESFWYGRAGAEAGFRFTPSFTLSAGGGWRYYRDKFSSRPLYSGIYAGLSLHFNIESASSSSGGIALESIQEEALYPAFLSLYQKNPAAVLRITNRESAEIRNLRVSFRAGDYTSSEFPCGTLPLIAKGRTGELPLYADFAPAILNFTGNGRILGEVLIRYTMLGRERQAVLNAAVQVHHRNTLSSHDPAALAAFVSPASPEVLEFSKYITGMARSNRRTGLNQNMQFGIWLFEGLFAGGLRVKAPPAAAPAEVQFPAETLGYRSGNPVDMGLLYAGALEAAGIRAAVIPLADDFILAFSLNTGEQEAALLFNGNQRLLIVNGEVWLPLSMGTFNEGFTRAWAQGVKRLNGAFDSGEEADFIILEDAWASYPSAPLPALGIRFTPPPHAAVKAAADRALDQYTASEIEPLLAAVRAELGRGPSAALYNRLGILSIRMGRNDDARAAYERAAGMGSAAGMTNRGNLALTEQDYEAAEKWFRLALEAAPENQAARRGLEKARESK